MGHGIASELGFLSAATARSVAETMQALAAPSRVRILSRLGVGACSVNDLARDVGMEQSAVSRQLRMLRHLGLVTGQRSGRTVTYALFDEHVAMLLDEAVYHAEHLHLDIRDRPESTAVS